MSIHPNLKAVANIFFKKSVSFFSGYSNVVPLLIEEMDYVCYYCNKTSQKKEELLDYLVMQHRHKRMRIKYKIFNEKTGFQTKDFNLVPTEILKASETFVIDEAKWEVYVEKRSDHQDADIKGVLLFDFDFELEEHASSPLARRPKYSAPKG